MGGQRALLAPNALDERNLAAMQRAQEQFCLLTPGDPLPRVSDKAVIAKTD